MPTTAEKLINQNNQLREKLLPNNKKFYEDFLLYIRLKGLLYPEHIVEDQLLEILQDILEAQNNGINANDFFGTNAQHLAENLLAELPRPNYTILFKGAAVVFLISSFFTLLGIFNSTNNQIALGVFIGNAIITAIILVLLLLLLKNSIYGKILSKKWLLACCGFLLYAMSLGSFILNNLLFNHSLIINLPNWALPTLMVTIVIVITLSLIFTKKFTKSTLAGIAPFIYITCLVGLLIRTDLLTNHTGGIIVIIGAFITLLWSTFLIRKD